MSIFFHTDINDGIVVGVDGALLRNYVDRCDNPQTRTWQRRGEGREQVAAGELQLRQRRGLWRSPALSPDGRRHPSCDARLTELRAGTSERPRAGAR